MTSKVTLSRMVAVITILVNLLLATAFSFIVRAILAGHEPVSLSLGAAVIAAAILVTPFFKPTHLILTDEALIIRFPLHKIRIPLTDIEAAEPHDKYKDYKDIRAFGSGGVWGYLGRFHNNGVGHYTAYAGDLSQSFYLRVKSGKTYLLSCPRHKDFVKALTSLTS